jgi:two-component system sensor histidine kinase KdpD
MHRQARVRDSTALVASVAAIVVTTALLRLFPSVSATTVALALLLIVLGAATVARLRIAIAVSVAAMLAFNFFFLPPVGTFTIAGLQNWIALFAFLVVAVIASQLSSAAHERAREAIASRNEVTRLFDLTRDVLLTTETTGAIDALARHVARRFELSRIAISLPADPSTPLRAGPSTSPGAGHGWRIHQGGSEEVLIETDTLDAALANARRDLRAGPNNDISIVPLRHGAKAIGLLLATSPALDIGTLDAIAGVVAIAIERAQFLAEREATELVRQKADLASTLLASLSHDLRTPLTAIRMAVENLRDELSPGERRVQATAAITELERLTRLFQDILDMARIDSAAIHVEREWVAPSDIVDAALAHVRHTVAGHALRVDAETAMEVELDPRLTSSALSHLLENAAKYSPSDREILVFARVEADGLHVSVSDRGPGLDPAELEHLFDRFFRGREARELTFGTGMGLSITRGLLAAAGGRVWAENVAGGGARFSIVVPGAVRAAAVAS